MTTAAKKKTVPAAAAILVAADDWLSVPDLRLEDGQRLAAVSYLILVTVHLALTTLPE